MLKTITVMVLLGMQFPDFHHHSPGEFSAVYDNRRQTVKIKWQDNTPGIKAFIIQRSADNSTWADIALRRTNENTGNKTYFFEDSKPAPGQNYYRLKSFTSDDRIIYSKGIMIITGSPGYAWVMYPVPVKDVLTLQYRGSEIIKGVINILIQNSSGNIITRVRSASLTKIIRIPVNNLGSGMYDVRIIVENEIIWNQRFIK